MFPCTPYFCSMKRVTAQRDLFKNHEVKAPVKKPVSLQYIHCVNVKPGVCNLNFDVGNQLTKP